MADDIEWLRELEHSTRNSMAKLNNRARTDALKRSESDLSVHKWAQTHAPSPADLERRTTSARKKKRPMSSESSLTSGARIMLSNDPIKDFIHKRDEAAGSVRLLPPGFVEKLPQVLAQRNHDTDGEGGSHMNASRYDPLPSLETISQALEMRKKGDKYSKDNKQPLQHSASLDEVSTLSRSIDKNKDQKTNHRRKRDSQQNKSNHNPQNSTSQPITQLTFPDPNQQTQVVFENDSIHLGGGGGGGGGENVRNKKGGKNVNKIPAKDLTTKDIYTIGGPSDSNIENENNKNNHLKKVQQCFTDGINFHISLNSDLIRSKYRDEILREIAWKQCQVNKLASKDLERDEGITVIIEELDRHPVPRWISNEIIQSNQLLQSMIRSRNKLPRNYKKGNDMKKIWKKNLISLKEHNTYDHASGLVSGNIAEHMKNKMNQNQKRGLNGGRDSEGIVEGNSQIQSVALLRALAGAYFTREPPIEPKPAPPSSRPAYLPLPPPIPPNIIQLSFYKPLLNFDSHCDGYNVEFGSRRYLVNVDRLTRPYSEEARWRVTLYDRYNGESRRHLLTETEAIHLSSTIKVKRGSITSSPHLLQRSFSSQHNMSSPNLLIKEQDDDKEEDKNERDENRGSNSGGGGNKDFFIDIPYHGGSESGSSLDDHEDDDVFDDLKQVVSTHRRDSLNLTTNAVNGVVGNDTVYSPPNSPGSPGSYGSGDSSLSGVTDYTRNTIEFDDTGNENAINYDTMKEQIKIHKYMYGNSGINGGKYNKHCEIAYLISQLVEDPDLETEETYQLKDLTIRGLSELRIALLEAALKAEEDAKILLAKQEEEALAKDSKLRELANQKKELKKMFKEEKIERYRLAVQSSEEEIILLNSNCNNFFLMCDRTIRGTIRKKAFIEVLYEEPEVAESLRIMFCLPLQALPEGDRDELGNRGVGPPSKELLGMVFDEVDESSGYISGEIPNSDLQKYILNRTGKYQKIDVNELVYIGDSGGGDGNGQNENNQNDKMDTNDSQVASSSSSSSSSAFFPTVGNSSNDDALSLADSNQAGVRNDGHDNSNGEDDEVEMTVEMKTKLAQEKWDSDNIVGGGFGWEDEADDSTMVPCLTIRVSDKNSGVVRSRIVPGIVVIGRPGLWWAYPLEEERTSAAGVFFRDVHAVMTSVPTIVMTMLLALDTPRLAPTLTSWETDSRIAQSPLDIPHAPTLPPMLMAETSSIRRRAPTSPYDTLMSTTVTILSDAELPLDFKPVKLNLGKGESDSDQHRRFWRFFNERKFRQRLPTSYTLFPCKETVAWTYAVNKSIVKANDHALSKRHTWHSEQRCVETLGRRREPKDLFASLDHKKSDDDVEENGNGGKRKLSGVTNESCVFMSRLDGTQLWALERWTFNSFETLYEEIAKQKEAEAKEEALASKVQAAAIDIKQTAFAQAKLKNGVLSGKARRRKKTGKGKVRPEFGIDAWESRLSRSIKLMTDMVGVEPDKQEKWEKWMDSSPQGQGAIFYKHISELDPLPYQWDAPIGWTMDASVVASNEQQLALQSSKSSSSLPQSSSVTLLNRSDSADSKDKSDVLLLENNAGGSTSCGASEEEVDPQITSPQALELLAPAAKEIAEQNNLRRGLLAKLVHNPKFIQAMVKKLEAARCHLELQIDQNGKDAGEDYDEDEGRELASDEDPWSDSDDEAGDWSGDMGFIPLDYADLRLQRIAQNRVEVERSKKANKISENSKKRRPGGKNKPTVPEIALPPQEEVAQGGIGRFSVPRLLRPGVTIVKEVQSIDSTSSTAESKIESTGYSGVENGTGDGLSTGLSQKDDDPASRVVVPSPVALFEKGGNRGPEEFPISAGRLRWQEMAPLGRPLAPHMKGAGWRNLERSKVEDGFIKMISSTRLVPKKHVKKELQLEPQLVGPWDVREATGYQPPSYETPMKAMLVRGDGDEGLNDFVAKKAAKADRRKELSSLMAQELSVQEMVKRKKQQGITAYTCLDNAIKELEPKEKENNLVIINQAITAVKNSDLGALETLMENYSSDVNFSTCEDSYGNTLFMIAVQQGSTRFSKYMLRKHADLNHQNLLGNTCLHYAYEYNNVTLGEYLISKGADPLIVNAEGCTCYEGLTQDGVKDI